MDKQMPVYQRLWALESKASRQGYNMRVDHGIVLWSRRGPKPGTMGELHTFAFNDNGIQAAFDWLEWIKDRLEE